MKKMWTTCVLAIGAGIVPAQSFAAPPLGQQLKLSLAFEPATAENAGADWSKAGDLSLEPRQATATSGPLIAPAQQRAAFGELKGTPSIEQRMLTLAQENAAGADGGSDANELAKKLSNPVANLISVPLQYNADFNAGATGKAHISRLNIQPVIPLSLNDHWNLIVRTILPVVYQEQLASGQGTNWGLGDTTTSLFFSPKQEIGGWILGAGPILLLPTGTDTALTGGKWGAGPTVLALRQEHGWTYGILASHTWSFAGDGDRGYVNSTFLQPFLSYQFPSATTVGLNTESIYDWRARQWTVPVNLFVSQVVKMGGHPVSFTLGGRFYTEGPSGGPDWGMRFVITLLFPK